MRIIRTILAMKISPDAQAVAVLGKINYYGAKAPNEFGGFLFPALAIGIPSGEARG